MHVPDVACNDRGTPQLDDMFHRAQRMGRGDRVCYVNADIILGPDILTAERSIQLPRFLMVGRRTNLDIVERIRPEDVPSVQARARAEGELFNAAGIDYFLFPRGQIMDMLPFPVGRAMWDNWVIFHMRQTGVPVIDATECVLAVHQNHDYSHIAGGQKASYEGTEYQSNWDLVGRDFLRFTMDDATWRLTDSGPRRVLNPRRLIRHTLRAPALVPGLRRVIRIGRAGKHLLGR
ncbi:MAG: hypothetical protein ACI9WU_005399 [Myxococcota bacterium]